MRIEEVVGRRVAEHRQALGLSQAELGERLAKLLGKPWPRQAIWTAEKGGRAFAVAELVALVEALHVPGVEDLLVPPLEVDVVELGGDPIAAQQLDTPRRGGTTRGDMTRAALNLLREQASRLAAEVGELGDLHAAQVRTVELLKEGLALATRVLPPDHHTEEER